MDRVARGAETQSAIQLVKARRGRAGQGFEGRAIQSVKVIERVCSLGALDQSQSLRAVVGVAEKRIEVVVARVRDGTGTEDQAEARQPCGHPDERSTPGCRAPRPV